MGELVFECMDVRPERYAATPTLNFRLRIAEKTGRHIHAIALHCQVRIQPHLRRYSGAEAELLQDLFGETSRWNHTLKPLHLTTVTVMVPSFCGSVEVDVPVTCTYDFEVIGTRYFDALSEGEIPLVLLFSGTVFHQWGVGFAVEPVPWHQEARYRLPVRVWRELMDLYFPDSAWIRLHRDVFHALERFKIHRALPTWEDTMTALLREAGEVTE